MSGNSNIGWTEKTWNPVVGCTRVSEGCRNCYAFALHDRRHAAHLSGASVPEQYHKPFKTIQPMPDRVDDPLHWRKPAMVFVNSMSDLFHEDIPRTFFANVWWTMAQANRHTFQVLTKRADRIAKTLGPDGIKFYARDDEPVPFPQPNIWLGVSVEDRKSLWRIDALRKCSAAVRFVSFEPLLENLGEINLNGIHWAIWGGESGPKYRRMDIEAFADGVEQCRAAGVSVFVKQDSGPRPGAQGRIPEELWAMKDYPTISQ